MKHQSTGAVLMVRPASFGFNQQTAETNVFQKPGVELSIHEILAEFDAAVYKLKSNGIEVIVWQDSRHVKKPDAIFPNNWLGVHPGKKLALYPMYAANRRTERVPELVENLKRKLTGYDLIDFSHFENEQQIVEGTGSLVFDHLQKKVFACRSERTNEALVNHIAGRLGCESIVFDAKDERGIPYYHTNVVLTIGTYFSIICEECIEKSQRENVMENLIHPHREIIRIDRKQLNSFAGNMLELKNDKGEFLIIMSATAHESLSSEQKERLGMAGTLVICNLPCIEQTGGGSIRCMLAELF